MIIIGRCPSSFTSRCEVHLVYRKDANTSAYVFFRCAAHSGS
jgi:hypothetical protein